MTDTFVGGLSFALGDVEATVEESAAAGRLVSHVDDLLDAGFRRHRMCGPGVSGYDLAKRCASEIPADLDGTGAIVYATCLPGSGNVADPSDFAATGEVKYLMDYPASRLQADLGLHEATVIGLNQQACTGMLGSLRVARALLHAEPDMEQVLCITSDRFPEGSLYEQTYNVISDGAAACVVSRAPLSFRLLACRQITNGALAQVTDDEVVGTLFSYTNRVIASALDQAGLAIADIDWVVPQNTNVLAWQIMARVIGVDFERVWFPTMADVGHVISGDNILNLAHLEQSGSLRAGDRLLVVMAGYGMNWQCTILEKT